MVWLSNNSIACILCFNNYIPHWDVIWLSFDFHILLLILTMVGFCTIFFVLKMREKFHPVIAQIYTPMIQDEKYLFLGCCQVMLGFRACELAYLFLSWEILCLLGILQFARGNLPAPGDDIFCPVPKQCHHTGPCQQCPLPDPRLQYLLLSQSHPDPTSPFPAGNTGHKGWEEHCQLYSQTQPNQSW